MNPNRKDVAGRMLVGLALAALAGVPVVAQPQSASPFMFVDATQDSGIRYRNVCGAELGKKGWLSESLGSGAGWLDYDGDGNLDLYTVNGSTYDRKPGEGEPNQLWRGDGKGHFVDVTDKAGVGDRGWGYGLAVGDYDNDGDPDIYVTNFGPNVLYRNDGDGTFTDVTQEARVGLELFSTAAVFFDMDTDGDLDLFVANYMDADPAKVPGRGTEQARKANCQYSGIPTACGPLGQVPLPDVLYRNNGDGTFDPVTRAAGMWLETPRFSLGAVTGDYDDDGDPDLYVAADSVANNLWRNNGDGTFTDVGMTSLSALNADGRAQAGMGTDFGDYDRDGWLDIVVTNFSQDYNTVYRNAQGKFFIDQSGLLGMNATQLALSWGVGLRDLDLDGDLDLLIANGHVYPQMDDFKTGTSFRQRNHVFVNDGQRFREVSATSGPAFKVERSFRGAAFADYDNDGDMDVFLTSLQEDGQLIRNDSARQGHWLEVRLIGVASNRDGVGTRVLINTAGKAQFREQAGGGSYLAANDPRLHFGLGQADRVDLIEVRWPSGTRDRVLKVPADRIVTIREGQGLIE